MKRAEEISAMSFANRMFISPVSYGILITFSQKKNTNHHKSVDLRQIYFLDIQIMMTLFMLRLYVHQYI